MMTFSFRPRRLSIFPLMVASVSTRVVSWNDAAEMKHSVESDALVIPSSSGRPKPDCHCFLHALVLFLEAEPIDLLVDQEVPCRPLLRS